SPAKQKGRALHKLVLEGPEAFKATFVSEPKPEVHPATAIRSSARQYVSHYRHAFREGILAASDEWPCAPLAGRLDRGPGRRRQAARPLQKGSEPFLRLGLPELPLVLGGKRNRRRSFQHRHLTYNRRRPVRHCHGLARNPVDPAHIRSTSHRSGP